jgi:transposase
MGRAFPQRGGRAVDEHSEIYVGLDVAKARHAVAVAGGERQGEVRYLGEIDADPASVRRMVARLEKRASDGAFLLRGRADRVWALLAIVGMGHRCTVVAPSLIPKRPGDRVKTSRRDAIKLAKLSRADKLTAV